MSSSPRIVRSGATRTTIVVAIAIAWSSGCARKPPSSDANGITSARLEPDPEEAPPSSASEHGHTAQEPAVGSPPPRTTLGPGLPDSGPWMTFYGKASEMGDLARVARTYRIIVIDADPGMRNFTDAQIALLRGGGRNRVISYMNLGSCETFRTYWASAPPGLTSCAANSDAQRGPYAGYPDETWMDVGDAKYQALVLEHIAPRLAARVDGFYLDNLEIVEHPASSANGPCTATCKQGGLDLVRKLREKYPRHLIVMQNATSSTTRLGVTGGVPFPLLLDGVAHEEVYAPTHDESAEDELVAWGAMGLASRDHHRFWIGVEDYVGSCRNAGAAHASATRARSRGFSPWASDESSGQRVVCFWD